MFSIHARCAQRTVIKAAILLIFISANDAMAQRTMKGQLFVGTESMVSIVDPRDHGLSLEFGQYTLKGLWSCRCTSTSNRAKILSEHTLNYMDICGEGGYLYRIVASRNRQFNLYGGGGVFIGYELYDPSGLLPSHIATELPKSGQFLYGITPRLEFEAFLSRKIGLSLGLSGPINFTSLVSMFRPRVSLGIRIDL